MLKADASTPQVPSGKQHAVGFVLSNGRTGSAGHAVAAGGFGVQVAPDMVPQMPMTISAQQGWGSIPKAPAGSAPPMPGGRATPMHTVGPHVTAAAGADAPAAVAPAAAAVPPVGIVLAGVSVVAVVVPHPRKKVAKPIRIHCALVLMLLALG